MNAAFAVSYLLIVEELHKVAPSGLWNYAIDSHRTGAIGTLAPYLDYKLFLSAASRQ
jgi:hypothetical protein